MAQIAKAANAIARPHAQAGPWQVRVVDGESGPSKMSTTRHRNQKNARDQPGRKLYIKAAVCAQSLPPVVSIAERLHYIPWVVAFSAENRSPLFRKML